jgi:hypothetical protein
LWNLLTFCWIDCLQRQSRWSLCHCSRIEQVGCMMHNWTHKRKWSAPGLLITTMLGITTENMTMLVLKWANTQAFVNLSRNAANSVWSHIPSSFLSKVFNCEFLFILLQQLPCGPASHPHSCQRFSIVNSCSSSSTSYPISASLLFALVKELLKNRCVTKEWHERKGCTTHLHKLCYLVLWAGNIWGLMIKLLLPHMVI